MIRRIQAKGFKPFGDLNISFPRVREKPDDLGEVHLLTGINGTGKTRILSLLCALLGNTEPLRTRIQGQSPFEAHIRNTPEPFVPETKNAFRCDPSNLAWLHAGNVAEWCAKVPAFAYSGKVFLHSHGVKGIESLPKIPREHHLLFNREPVHSQPLLQALTTIKVQGLIDKDDFKELTPESSRSLTLIESLENAISYISGKTFKFRVTTNPSTTISVLWGGVPLQFDALPDGLRMIAGWLAHATVTFNRLLDNAADIADTESVFLLDEIEGHLHPAWQRKILPAFQKLFPKSQIFVATHSPFVITSLNHGWIHKFTFDANNVKLADPVPAKLGDSYISVLEDIMGVTEMYDPETELLLTEFRKLRELAYGQDAASAPQMIKLAESIGKRSFELEIMMGKEIAQFNLQQSRKS